MKLVLTSLDLHFLVRELQWLLSAKVVKVYQPLASVFIIVLHVPSKGKIMLRVNLPGQIFVTDFKGEMPETPTQFCLALRKYLAGARLRSLRQLGFERIVELLFETKEAKHRLIIELFSKGNIILCSDDSIIKVPLYPQKWKNRTIRGNAPYVYPERPNNALEMGEAELVQLLKGSDKESIVKALALDLGLGGRYAEELCLRSGVDKAAPAQAAAQSIFPLLKALREQEISASIVLDQGRTVDIVPVKLMIYEGLTLKPCASYSEALSSVLTEQAVADEQERADEAMQKERRRLEKMIEGQKASIARIEEDILANQRRGELIFENYALVEEIITELRKARKRLALKEMRERLKAHSVVKEFDGKKAVIEIGQSQ